jgi:hypothetical protein
MCMYALQSKKVCETTYQKHIDFKTKSVYECICKFVCHNFWIALKKFNAQIRTAIN